MSTTPASPSAPTSPLFDAAIIGGGAAGLTAAMVLGRQMRHVLVIDSGDPRNAPSPAMHMFLSRDGFSPTELLRLARAELAAYPGIEHRNGVVDSITGHKGDFRIRFGGREARARYILLATGLHDQLGSLPGLPERWGRGVYHCTYCHGYESTDTSIGVIASRPADADLARYLADRFSHDVMLFTQGIAMDAVPGVTLIDAPVTRISGTEPDLRLHLGNGETVLRNRVFFRPEATQSNRLAEELGCAMIPKWSAIAVNAQQQTSVPGVYAAGDCAMNPEFPHPIGYVAASSGDGQRAAIGIDQELFSASG